MGAAAVGLDSPPPTERPRAAAHVAEVGLVTPDPPEFRDDGPSVPESELPAESVNLGLLRLERFSFVRRRV